MHLSSKPLQGSSPHALAHSLATSADTFSHFANGGVEQAFMPAVLCYKFPGSSLPQARAQLLQQA